MKELPPSASDETQIKASNDTISETVETLPTPAGVRITPPSGYCKKCSKIAWNSREKLRIRIYPTLTALVIFL